MLARTFRRSTPAAALAAASLALLSCVDGANPVASEDACDTGTASTPLAQVALYQGPLYDTHAHLDESGFASRLGCQMLAHDVERAVLFVHMDPDEPTDSEENLETMISGFPGRFVPFFHVDPKSPADVAPECLSRVYDDRSSTFRGIGEFGLYRSPWQGSSLLDYPWPDVFAWAVANDVWLMIHARPNQADEVDRMLSDYPDAKVLLHGFDFPDRVPQLLRDHPNLHFTIDTSVLLVDESTNLSWPIMFPPQTGADGFVADVDGSWQALLDAAVARWTPVVEAAPDRVFWGTDVAMDWHAEPEVYARLVDFSRAFVDRLPAAHRDAFAHGNARRLLGAGL